MTVGVHVFNFEFECCSLQVKPDPHISADDLDTIAVPCLLKLCQYMSQAPRNDVNSMTVKIYIYILCL